ncbi:MAG: energy-coupling factor transporter transmembrane component T [bacterium]|nr:energy-coupling factor transporter transmembrane component T [bacterium]
MRLDTRTWALLPFAVALNVVMGWTASPLPVHLDSLGTCIAAALAGPAAGMLTGAIGNIISALQNPIWLRYFPVAIMIGALTGLLTRWKMLNSAFLAGVSGIIIGICSASLAAPITAWSGGASGGGTDLLIAAFRELGYSKLSACFAESLLVDPLDKMISCLAVYAFLSIMPSKMRSAFPNGPVLSHIQPLKANFAANAAKLKESATRQNIEICSVNLSIDVPGSSFWHRAATSTKFLLILCSAIALFAVPGWIKLTAPQPMWYPLPYYPVLLASLFALAISSGIGAELGRLLLWTAFPLGLAITLINGLWGQGDEIAIGPLHWSIASACQASSLAMGITLVTESIGLLLLTTPIYNICSYLERCGVPGRINYILLASLNLIPSMQRRSAEIRETQAARAMPSGSGLRHWLRTLLPSLIPLLLSAIADAHERALTLEMRGFSASSSRTSWSTPQVPSYDPMLKAGILLVFITIGVLICA